MIYKRYKVAKHDFKMDDRERELKKNELIQEFEAGTSNLTKDQIQQQIHDLYHPKEKRDFFMGEVEELLSVLRHGRLMRNLDFEEIFNDSDPVFPGGDPEDEFFGLDEHPNIMGSIRCKHSKYLTLPRDHPEAQVRDAR